ncbi:LysM peptidoglycan-binding domain-containing protein [Thermoflavimicrobium daqui]|nr:LysM peptidoglycan-binding domain-containing protein [Thermoflavimicrobium daqui]
MAIYSVKSGDTLWSISQKTGVSIQTIRRVNGLVSEALVPGLGLYIPDQGLPERFYQVRSGDTFWTIAQRFNTRVETLIQANPQIQPNRLRGGERLRILTPNKFRMDTLGFVDAFSPTSFLRMIDQIAPHLTYLAIFTYSFRSDGTLIPVDDARLISESRRYGVKPLMVLSNLVGATFVPELAEQVIVNENVRRTLIQNVVRTLGEKGYAGVSIDFEFVPPNRRNEFTNFLRELKEAMGERILHINAHAKTADNPTNRLVGFLDYRAIGRVVDIMAVMTIDYGFSKGPPDPIAPTWWVEQVINYAISQVNRRKLMIGIPLYGYDWRLPYTPNTVADTLSANRAQNLAIRNRVSIQYDWDLESPWYQYQQEDVWHRVWFEDIRSLVAKYRLVEIYNLLGVTYWQLGFAFPQNWAYLEKNIELLTR